MSEPNRGDGLILIVLSYVLYPLVALGAYFVSPGPHDWESFRGPFYVFWLGAPVGIFFMGFLLFIMLIIRVISFLP